MWRGSRRLVEYLTTILVVLTLNFALPRLMPGDPFLHLGGEHGEEVTHFTEAQLAAYRSQYGLDRPWPEQYLVSLGALLRGDLGYSLYYNQEVATLLATRLPWTLLLVLAAVLLSTVIGSILGSYSATQRHTTVDRLLYPLMVALAEIPSFLLGLVLLFWLAADLALFPLSGAISHFFVHPTIWAKLADIAHHAALPILTLTLVRIGAVYLLARNATISVIGRDYLRTARAKGLGPWRILLRHSLRNAMAPVITRVFLSLGGLVGGAILVENVFAYPGLGRLLRDAVLVHDYPLIQGIFLLVALLVLSANFLADLLYRRLDPRVGGERHPG